MGKAIIFFTQPNILWDNKKGAFAEADAHKSLFFRLTFKLDPKLNNKYNPHQKSLIRHKELHFS
jgi:hypothetical protein